MKKLTALFILWALLMGLCACGTTADTTETTAPADTYNYPQINQKLTWEAINAISIKSADMTTDEMRDLCVSFFEFSKTALWTPGESWAYTKTADGETDEMFKGQIYGGLPYIGTSSGNIYRLMDYIDEDTGVVDMSEPMKNPKLFGNQCSIGAYWGWARVINSADYSWTYDMVQSRGFLRVGPYTYDDKLVRFQTGLYETPAVIRENGEQTMFQSYAAIKKADGLVTYTTAGHTMMCYSDPVVVYRPDGTIDGNQSYVHIIDQHTAWTEGTNEAGDTYQYKNYLNRKFTFNELMLEGYIPFTFAEFLGTNPVEETECTFSHTGNTITPLELMGAEVTANYGISDIYAIAKDSDGNEVISCIKRAETAGVTSLNFFKLISTDKWAPYTTGDYTVEVVCQLSTGERLTIYQGTLVK